MKSYNLKMDLQLFADPSASLQNTTGTMTNEMKTFYEKRLIDQAEPRLVHDQFADYYPVPQNGGKTIEFRKYDSLPKADTPLTEGVTPNGQTLNVTTITSDLAPVRRLDPAHRCAADDGHRQQCGTGHPRSGKPGGPHHGQHHPRCAGRRHQRYLCAEAFRRRHRDCRHQPQGAGQELHPDPEAVLPGGGTAGRDER